MPVVKAAGIDPIYFGVLFIINNSIGLITPPVGVVLNVVAGVTRISMEDVMKGVWPFLLAELFVLLLIDPVPAPCYGAGEMADWCSVIPNVRKVTIEELIATCEYSCTKFRNAITEPRDIRPCDSSGADAYVRTSAKSSSK